MDNKLEILLGSQKNINSVNADNYNKIELTNSVSEINEFSVNDVVNSTEVFDAERESNQVYRIYGRIEYLSLLNGLKGSGRKLEDFFNPQHGGGSKDIFNSFDFYLVAPAPFSGDTYDNISNTNKYKRIFQVIAGKDDFELYPAGFTNNVYGEQVYSFNFKSDFDVSNYFDKLGFPLTELFLYVQYRMSGNDEMSLTTWSTSTGLPTKTSLSTVNLNVGDYVVGNNNVKINDIIEFIPEEYYQAQVESQAYYIRTSYLENTTTKWLEWSYNPFIPFRLCYLDSVVSTAKLSEIVKNTTSLDIYNVDNSSINISLTKSSAQIIRLSSDSIVKWNVNSTPNFNWNQNTGELVFVDSASIEYNINFKTQIYLPNGSDKYIAEIYMEERIGTSSWNEIPNTKRKFLITNSTQAIHIIRTYKGGDRIRVRITLIPNPEKRIMFEIPDYALMLTGEGKYVWRDILPQGYIDPLTGLGVDYPFLNKRRYLFSPIILDVIPNLSDLSYNKHPNTINVFSEIKYYQNATNINIKPLTELDNIEKPCQ